METYTSPMGWSPMVHNVCIRTHIYVHPHTHTHTYMYTTMHTIVWAYIQTCIHTHTHTRTLHTHVHVGPVDASKTVFIDQTHVIVVTRATYHAMTVVPKDSFGNTAIITQEYLTVEIRKVCTCCVQLGA